MPEKRVVERARAAARKGKSPSSQAGEFVREEMHHVREGKHGARSTKQAIAIGLSKARRAGVPLPPPKRGKVSAETREGAERAYEAGQAHPAAPPSPTRSRAITAVLRRERRTVASKPALARQARGAALRRSRAERSASARQAARTRARGR